MHSQLPDNTNLEIIASNRAICYYYHRLLNAGTAQDSYLWSLSQEELLLKSLQYK
jgi:hypothetical protein